MNPLECWTEEQRSAFLYRVCADAESGTVRAELFRRLAGEAEAQAAIWRAQLTSRGHPAPGPFIPDARTRLVANLVQWLGPRRLKNVLSAMNVRGMAVYGPVPHAVAGHSVLPAEPLLERRHRGIGGGNLRAAVFGVNDGLMSNAALMLGVAGATSDLKVVVLTGAAGVAAGAFAMAAGEYVSVQSKRELYDHRISIERDELKHHPEAEAQELALIYAAKGLPPKQADRLAKRLAADPQTALETLARDELGVDPADLGTPLRAAVGAFAAFGAGALVPLAPYLANGGADALRWSIGVTAASLFGVGAMLSLFTGRNAVGSGVRMLVLGALAGGATFALGHVLGVLTG
jgi:VIT1/CCC1 family predicted Fe2+/Mn2+ transporter